MIPPLFLLASIAVIAAPGPDILYVVAKGISQGRRAALIASLGFACGLSVHTTLAALGLSALLVASVPAFTILKLSGAAYLLYLGMMAFRSQGFCSIPSHGEAIPGWRIFRQAFVMNVINPKVALFFLAFLPQFTQPGRGASQLLMLGGCFAVLSLMLFSLAGVCSSMLGHLIHARPRLTRGLDYLVGAVFVLLGIQLAVSTLH
ncbi:MAG: LysE family translocator [Verrucomicrobiota bacterium]